MIISCQISRYAIENTSSSNEICQAYSFKLCPLRPFVLWRLPAFLTPLSNLFCSPGLMPNAADQQQDRRQACLPTGLAAAFAGCEARSAEQPGDDHPQACGGRGAAR